VRHIQITISLVQEKHYSSSIDDYSHLNCRYAATFRYVTTYQQRNLSQIAREYIFVIILKHTNVFPIFYIIL